MPRRSVSLGVALCLSASVLAGMPGAAWGQGESPAPIASAVPAWSASKAGVFVLVMPADGAVPELATLTTGLAGVEVGVLTSGTVPEGVRAIADGDGALAARYALTPGAAVALRADGTEIGRFSAGTAATKIADAIEASRRAKVGEYNLPKKSGVALNGYDAVSYFEAAGPVKGSASFATRYRGVTYQFADASRRAAFNADPERYLPTYGGWCATAMAEGDKVEIDPTNYKVTNGRLFLFYKGFLGNAKKDWDKDEKGLEVKADTSWVKISGEKR
ncbi:MAG: YHS domain-containing (seleno)protein [Phycisphaerales bacterium]